MDDLNGTPRPEPTESQPARRGSGDATGTGRPRQPQPWVWIAILVAVAGLAGAVVAWLWRRRLARRPSPPPPPIRVQGLTEQEAEARRLEGQDNVIEVKPRRTKQEIWRENAYNIFNLNLVGLAIAQLLLGRPLDALLSVGTIALNIGINLFQEMFSRRRLSEIELATRPRATVIRDDRVRSIDPSEIVLGDALIIGPGDQVLVDGELIGEGQIVVDESLLTGQSGWRPKAAGDKVLAGSFCLSGRAACQVEAVGDQRSIAARLDEAPAAEEELTPLQRVIERVLRYLMVFVAVATLFILIQYFRVDLGASGDLVNEAISIIFNIAPATLFLMIIVTYATGTADLGRLGALVYRAQSVESLAQSTVICFAKAGILTGTVVEMELPETDNEEDPDESGDPAAGQPALAESRLRQILGDYARTTSVDNLAIRGMADTFEGSPRVAAEEAPFLAVYGWSAIAFDDEDLRGVYVLAEPSVLEAHLATQGEEGGEQAGGALNAVRNAVAPVGRVFGRVRGLLPGREDEEPATGQPAPAPPDKVGAPGEPDTATAPGAGLPGETGDRSDRAGSAAVADQGSATSGEEPGEDPAADSEAHQDEQDGKPGLFGRLGQRFGRVVRGAGRAEEYAPEEQRSAGEDDERQPGLFRRIGSRFGRLLGRGEPAEEEKDASEKAVPEHETVLAFAYRPDIAPLHDAAGEPHLPPGLIPLCTLRYTQRVRPEAVETIKVFSRTGVGIKVFASGPPEQTATMLRQAGMGAVGSGTDSEVGTISGKELDELDQEQFSTAAAENTVFGDLSPEQAGQVVAALRHGGESVAVIGDAVADLPAMRQANLAVSRKSSTQAALSVSDIVLLEDSPAVLSVVLQKGQKIVNGLMDVLRLNLTQVLYLALLIVAIRLLAYGFPYRSGQGTVITIATIALPSLGLSLGAAAGLVPKSHLGRLLARFVLPSALTIAATALAVYLIFLDRSGDVSYAQLGLTYTLVGCGLVLVIFIKPPRWRWYRGRVQGLAWWPVVMAVVLYAVFLLVCAIPLFQNLLKVGLLGDPAAYQVVALAVLAWALVLRFALWIMSVPGRR
jgi:magnesium-transporting ATPase (P-type)